MTQAPPWPIGPRDRGPAVVDLQRRLADAGFPCGAVDGDYGPATTSAVQSFQLSRNLPGDGAVDGDTWAALVEAGWRLGDRVLYERRPWLRGDDVADLQQALANLGFRVGKVDGIFGPLARGAIEDFQRNAGLVPDGIAGPETLRTLARVGTAPAGRADPSVRETTAFAATGFAGTRIFIDPGPLHAAVGANAVIWDDPALAISLDLTARLRAEGAATLLGRSAESDPPVSDRATLANTFGAALLVGLEITTEAIPAGGMISVSYYSTPRYESRLGREVAHALTDACARSTGMAVSPPQAASAPLLRETRAVATIVTMDVDEAADLREGAPLPRALVDGLVEGLSVFLRERADEEARPATTEA